MTKMTTLKGKNITKFILPYVIILVTTPHHTVLADGIPEPSVLEFDSSPIESPAEYGWASGPAILWESLEGFNYLFVTKDGSYLMDDDYKPQPRSRGHPLKPP